MAGSTPDDSANTPASPPSISPDDLVKDLDVKLSEEEKDTVIGGALPPGSGMSKGFYDVLRPVKGQSTP